MTPHDYDMLQLLLNLIRSPSQTNHVDWKKVDEWAEKLLREER